MAKSRELSWGRVASPCGFFTRIAKGTAQATGHPSTFLVALAIVAVWGITGPLFNYSDTWQLVINTGTTIITFLMVFPIQNTQNRDSQAVQIKLDELIRAAEAAHNALLDLEELTDEELAAMRESYIELAREAKQSLQQGSDDTGVTDPKEYFIESGRREGQGSPKSGRHIKSTASKH